MKKLFCILFLLFSFLLPTFAENEIKIISREEWGADESIRYIDSPEWTSIIEQRKIRAEESANTVYTQEQVDAYKLRQQKLIDMDQILLDDFGEEIAIDSVNYFHKGRALAWPEAKTKQVKGIVIHHTVSDYEDSYEGVRQIYKYHTLTNEWGDIGYNYIIGKNGEIFEGRAGGDYVVGAHDSRNNRATVGISIIGNYSDKEINIDQYNALRLLTRHLIDKYDIDLNEKTYFHKECLLDTCEKPLTSELMSPIIGHRDAGHTACPGDALYKQLDELRADLLKDSVSVSMAYKKKIYAKLEKFSDQVLIDILAKIEFELDKEAKSNKQKLKGILLDYFEYKNKKTTNNTNIEIGEIKIKLSYPDKDMIRIKNGDLEFEITRKGNFIYIKGIKFDVLEIPKKDPNSIFEITSWERKPTWDTSGVYNDNKFRGNLTIYVKDNQLQVVNTLDIEDYLKGLGEVSNFEDTQKIKTIITAARTYAAWYTTEARKFPGEFYDGVDDPNVFQKYLGYGLEERSPKINTVVDQTKGKVITYNGKLIKPWYFTSSDGKTMSFYDYCAIRYSDEICYKESLKYPYLQSVTDKGGEGKEKLGHGVGIPGTGVSYFATKGWSYDMIIRYFLKGVEIL